MPAASGVENGCRVDKKMINTLGPVSDTELLPGEMVAVRTRRVLSRKGRCVVRVRLFGVSSLGWLDTARLWGTCVEVFVCQGGIVKHLVEQLYPDVHIAPLAEALEIPPYRCWDGVLLATIDNQSEADQLHLLVEKWRPQVIIIATHAGRTSKSVFERRTNYHDMGYTYPIQYVCWHNIFGGVTNSGWRIRIFVTRLDEPLDLSLNRMTAGLYPRYLQTALDDTIGPAMGSYHRLEENTRSNKVHDELAIGVVNGTRPLYESSGLGPDLAVVTSEELDELWVLAASVFSKKKVLRRISRLELLAMWDYAGKIWYKGMSKSDVKHLLIYRLMSPPAKILTAICFTAFQQLLQRILPATMYVITAAKDDTSADQMAGLMELKGIQRAKAALADDAGVELSYWALPNETPEQTKARHLLRVFAHLWWVYNLAREAYAWLKANGNLPRDKEAIDDCIRRAAGSDYWDWHRGSRLFFWRFPTECGWQADARDGVEFWHLCDPPKGLHFQNIPPSCREAELQLRAKVFQLKFRWYLEEGTPDLVTPRFSLEKLADEQGKVLDIRCVWDAKRNGLNDTLWAPSFSLSTTRSAEDLVVKWLLIPVGDYLRQGSPPQDYSQDQDLMIKDFQYDLDVAQQFNNYQMHKKERHSHGVRYISTRNDGSMEPQTFLQCSVLNFGCVCSPYVATQGQERIMELCEGDPSDPLNPFQYHECWLNLPASRNYDPSMPRVILLRTDGEKATRRVTFVDDIHGSSRGRDAGPAREASRVLAGGMNYLGNQDAARKRGPPTLIPRPWNGFMTHTDTPYPVKGTTAKKWNRGRAGLEWVWQQLEIPGSVTDPIEYIKSLQNWEVRIDTAELRRVAGLWIHLTETYKEGRCFLKGFFNALEAFRSDRDLDGWRLQVSMDECQKLEDSDASRHEALAEYPALTRVTYQLVLHVSALRKLFDSPTPRVVPIRPTEKHKLRYACGDASAEGFADAVQYPDLVIDERDGLWLPEMADKSSNLREALNIANKLKLDITAGRHDGCEVWQATDNAVWSAVCNKGMSSVRHLFDLLVDIKVLCHQHQVFYNCFHISGERMIATGIDGMSRGDKDSGIALGYDLRDFLPLDVGAFDYPDNQLEDWCRGWMLEDYTQPKTPLEWFNEAHKPGVHIIAPPPAAAIYALEEIAKGRHKRPQYVTYVILIPRILYQEEWRGKFQKEVDVWFPLLTGKFWPNSAYEPLMVGISFPLYRTRPWLLRMERDKVVEIGRTLSAMSKICNLRVRDYLRELWSEPRTFIQQM